jgi:hypothetical protein
LGREASLLAAVMPKNSERIMFLASLPVVSLTNSRISTLQPVSRSTWQPL